MYIVVVAQLEQYCNCNFDSCIKMLFHTGFVSLVTLISSVTHTSAAPAETRDKAKPAAFYLAGDSTTAVQSTGGGGNLHLFMSTCLFIFQETCNLPINRSRIDTSTGWGTGFLTTTLKKGATGQNFGHNGATTVSFRAGGDWANVLTAAKASLTSYTPYVTIQFGHNDQKPEKNISMADLTANLVKFVEEVRAVPATPILVTSISRRRFSNSTGKIVENLADVTAAAKAAAAQTSAYIIDLNAASMKYLNAIGPDKAATYNLNPTDFTHLNSQGSVVFGNMVAQLIDGEVEKVRKYVQPGKEIVKAFKKGTYYFPATCEGAFCG